MKFDIVKAFNTIAEFQQSIYTHVPWPVQHLRRQFNQMTQIAIANHEMMEKTMIDQSNQTHEEMHQVEIHNNYLE